jgi:hypothetical protein
MHVTHNINTGTGIVLSLVAISLPGCSSSTPDLWRAGTPIPHPKSYVCSHTTAPLTIDGRLDEQDWITVPWTDDFADIEGDRRPVPRFRTRAKMLWDDEFFLIGAEISDPHIWGTLVKRDTVIFYDNDFELFIDPNSDNHEYYEFEMNALNTVWDLLLPKPYRDLGSAVDSWNIDGLRTAVSIRGTINDPRDTDTSWTVEIAMPWKALGAYAHKPIPPVEGDQWRVNFSRVEWTTVLENGKYVKVKGKPEDNWVWSPQWVVNMHWPELWGFVQFTRKPAGTVAFLADGSWDARCALLRVYHAQKAFYEDKKRWAATKQELGASAFVPVPGESSAAMQLTDSGYVCSVRSVGADGRMQEWKISQDSRIWMEGTD